MPIHEALNDEMVSTGICTRCQQDLIQIGDTLGCPVCGESVSISRLHAAFRSKIDRFFDPQPRPKPNANVGASSFTNYPSSAAWGRTGAVKFPFPKKFPIGSFTELLNDLRRREGK